MILTFVSKGKYGKVYKLQLLNEEPIAIKIGNELDLIYEKHMHEEIYKKMSKSCKKYTLPLKNLKQDIITKIRIQLKLSKDEYIIAMKYVDNVTLYQYLKFHSMPKHMKSMAVNNLKNSNHKIKQMLLKKKSIVTIRNKLHNALYCLWKSGFIHSDLHLNNIIVDTNLNLFIIDFGQTFRVNPLPANVKITDIQTINTWFAIQWLNEYSKSNYIGNPNIMLFSDKLKMNYFALHHLPIIKNFMYKSKKKCSSIKTI